MFGWYLIDKMTWWTDRKVVFDSMFIANFTLKLLCTDDVPFKYYIYTLWDFKTNGFVPKMQYFNSFCSVTIIEGNQYSNYCIMLNQQLCPNSSCCAVTFGVCVFFLYTLIILSGEPTNKINKLTTTQKFSFKSLCNYIKGLYVI